MKIGLIVGHTLKASGAQAPDNQMSEYVYNSNLAKEISCQGTMLGHEIFIIYKDRLEQQDVIKLTNNLNADCTVELHCNAFKGEWHGTQVDVLQNQPNSFLLATAIYNEIIFVLSRGKAQSHGVVQIKHGDRGVIDMYGLIAPCCLVEPFYIDNKEDFELGMNSITSLADAILHGALKFCDNLPEKNN
jgi:N-acetylmuramoyl-L-alanine amidase